MVSSKGRVFAIMDMATFASRPAWHVIARDAFNGRLLWKRSLPSWGGGGHKKIGPVQMHRTLVAKDDRLGVGLHRYALMILADASEAEDAVHQVFAALIQRGADKIDAPEHYLRRAVRNECLSRMRHRQTGAAADSARRPKRTVV